MKQFTVRWDCPYCSHESKTLRIPDPLDRGTIAMCSGCDRRVVLEVEWVGAATVRMIEGEAPSADA